MRNHTENNSGFTLVELMITIAVAAILLTMAALSMDFVRREQVTSTAKEVFADIQRVRSDAISRGTTATPTAPVKRGVGIRFVSPTSFVVFSFNDIFPLPLPSLPPLPISASGNYAYDNASEEADVVTRVLSSGQLSVLVGGALIAPANNIVIFDRFGYPRQANWQLIGAMTIAINNPALGYTRCITINTNSIREGFWDNVATACIVQ